MPPDTHDRATPALKDPSLLRQQCYVDGAWRDADNGGTHPVVNPATGRIIGTTPVLGAAETRVAIEGAAKAWPAWRAVSSIMCMRIQRSGAGSGSRRESAASWSRLAPAMSSLQWADAAR